MLFQLSNALKTCSVCMTSLAYVYDYCLYSQTSASRHIFLKAKKEILEFKWVFFSSSWYRGVRALRGWWNYAWQGPQLLGKPYQFSVLGRRDDTYVSYWVLLSIPCATRLTPCVECSLRFVRKGPCRVRKEQTKNNDNWAYLEGQYGDSVVQR